MEIKNYFAQDAQGNIMPSANCYLYLPGTTTLATGLVDGNGIPISNPFLASGMGQITFGAPNGVYDLRVALGARDWTIKVQCADIVQAMYVMDSILGSHAENPATRNNGQPLEPGDETWNSTDKQPYWWNGTAWVALNSSVQALELALSDDVDTSKGVSVVGRGAVSVNTVESLIGIPASSIKSTSRYLVASYFDGWASVVPFIGPRGGGEFVWDATRPKSSHNGGTIISPTVPWSGAKASLPDFLAGTGETMPSGTGCFVRVFDVLTDVMFGVTQDGTDETAQHQRALNSLAVGGTYRLTGASNITSLTGDVDSVTLDSTGTPYAQGGGFNLIGAGTGLLVTAPGWTVDRVLFRDQRPALGSATVGSAGLWFERAGGVNDLDAAVKNCLFSKLETAIGGKGINVKVTGCTFSYCKYFVDAYQIGALDFRGWVIAGQNRFHGRTFSGGSVAVRFTGTARTMQVQQNYFDDCEKAFEGWLDRRSIFDSNIISGGFTTGYVVDVTGGAYGRVSNNTLGSLGLSGGIRAANCTSLRLLSNDMDSVRQHGILLESTTNSFVKNNIGTNINNVPADGNVYDGIHLDANSNSNEVEDNSLFQVGSKGRYGINNLGNGNYFGEGGNDITGFVTGPYNQDLTKTAFGMTGASLVRPRTEYATAAPTTGNHRQGDERINLAPSLSNPVERWKNTVAGAPGTWRALSWITFSGSTAQRPVLRADDAGVQFMDTTLAASGKPIWWRGTAWVDATGASV